MTTRLRADEIVDMCVQPRHYAVLCRSGDGQTIYTTNFILHLPVGAGFVSVALSTLGVYVLGPKGQLLYITHQNDLVIESPLQDVRRVVTVFDVPSSRLRLTCLALLYNGDLLALKESGPVTIDTGVDDIFAYRDVYRIVRYNPFTIDRRAKVPDF
jgi:hypothetical protein